MTAHDYDVARLAAEETESHRRLTRLYLELARHRYPKFEDFELEVHRLRSIAELRAAERVRREAERGHKSKERVRARHRPEDTGATDLFEQVCAECRQVWPCWTFAELSSANVFPHPGFETHASGDVTALLHRALLELARANYAVQEEKRAKYAMLEAISELGDNSA
ncbi:MAG TPA: hypothetical protein VK631_14845 [Solirubrobacteraceae bacterium]|nr:hypothetical protein [Solirubrobacteraceae bacterium]